VQLKRADLSHGLVHLTKARRETEWVPSEDDILGGNEKLIREITPFEVLKEILASGVLRAGHGFIKGSHAATCFSEMPLSAVPSVSENGNYSNYGICFTKRDAFRCGCRPVIYLPDSEIGWIPRGELWRVVRFEPINNIDHTHEREWRVNADIDLTAQSGLLILVDTVREARELLNSGLPIIEKATCIPMKPMAAFM
jgi:hypothetical protein